MHDEKSGDYTHHRILVNDGTVYKYDAKDLDESPTDAEVKASVETHFAGIKKVSAPSVKTFVDTTTGKKISEL